LLPQSGSEAVRELVSLERDVPRRRARSIFGGHKSEVRLFQSLDVTVYIPCTIRTARLPPFPLAPRFPLILSTAVMSSMIPLTRKPLPGARPAAFWLPESCCLPEMVEEGLKVSEIKVENKVGE